MTNVKEGVRDSLFKGELYEIICDKTGWCGGPHGQDFFSINPAFLVWHNVCLEVQRGIRKELNKEGHL